MNEITFIITEDDIDGGYTARAHWPDGNRDIIIEGDTRDELLQNIRKAIDVSFDSDEKKPGLIHLQYVPDEMETAWVTHLNRGRSVSRERYLEILHKVPDAEPDRDDRMD